MSPTVKELNCIRFAQQFYPKKKPTFFEKLFGKRTDNTNYSVSSDKTFFQFWSDYGLRDYGVNYLHRGGFTKEQKIACIKFWVKELYSKEADIKQLLDSIQEDLIRERQKWMKENPGGHISMSDPIDVLPQKIDKMFGKYL
jgi:hypothetical protein